MNARPMLDVPLKDAPRLVEVVGGVEHELDPQSVLAPLLDLVEVLSVSSSDQLLIARCKESPAQGRKAAGRQYVRR
jgi:hypothetical protein